MLARAAAWVEHDLVWEWVQFNLPESFLMVEGCIPEEKRVLEGDE